MKKPETKKSNERKTIDVNEYEVSKVRIHDESGTVFFNLFLNGVTIYGCTVGTTKDGHDFIAFPSRKGKDGKYYSIAYASISDEDQDKILKDVETQLNS